MIKFQRAAGLLFVLLGGAGEAVAFDAGRLDTLLVSRCAAFFGAVLYSLTMTGRKTDALTALLPIPVLAPAAAVLLAWKRGDLSRPSPAPRRVARFAEVVGLGLALAAVGGGASAYAPSIPMARAHMTSWVAKPLPAPVAPAPVLAAPAETAYSIVYQVHFLPGKVEMNDESRSILNRVADTMHYYPLDDILLTAPLPTGDADGTALSLARLEEVRQDLVDHGLRRSRIRTQLRPADGDSRTVQLSIVEN